MRSLGGRPARTRRGCCHLLQRPTPVCIARQDMRRPCRTAITCSSCAADEARPPVQLAGLPAAHSAQHASKPSGARWAVLQGHQPLPDARRARRCRWRLSRPAATRAQRSHPLGAHVTNAEGPAVLCVSCCAAHGASEARHLPGGAPPRLPSGDLRTALHPPAQPLARRPCRHLAAHCAIQTPVPAIRNSARAASRCPRSAGAQPRGRASRMQATPAALFSGGRCGAPAPWRGVRR